jgi:hypothetical protein
MKLYEVPGVEAKIWAHLVFFGHDWSPLQME